MDGWMFHDVNVSGSQALSVLIEDDPLWFRNEGPYPDNEDGADRLGTGEYHAGVRHSLLTYGGCVGRMIGSASSRVRRHVHPVASLGHGKLARRRLPNERFMTRPEIDPGLPGRVAERQENQVSTGCQGSHE